MMVIGTSRKYQMPSFLSDIMGQSDYEQWLLRKARAHVKRDRRRGNAGSVIEAYKLAVHKAVGLSNGVDAYTGEKLQWHLIGKYDNEKSRLGRRTYKATLAFLPTVDHVGDGLGVADFRICGWRTNDAKNDLSYEEFVKLCRRVVDHHAKKP